MSLTKSYFKGFFVAVLLCISSLPAFAGVTIYSSGMSTASDWSEDSDAVNETGDVTGGIRVVDGDKVQMNSWWDTANWTVIWRSTGWTIAANKEYVMTVSMTSYSGGTAVVLKFNNETEGSTVIASASVNPSASSWGDFTVSFSTAGGQNSGAVGDVLGIAVEPGWWNNLGVTSVKVTEKDPGEPIPAESYSINLNTTYQAFSGLGVGTIFYQSHLTDGSPEAGRADTYKKLFTDVPHGYHMVWLRPNSEITNDNSDPYNVNLGAFTMVAENEDYVTILNESVTRNPDVKLAATVMTPPAWLKTNRSTAGNGTLDTTVPNAYLEFAEFVFANLLWYKQQGLSIEVVTLMNEPDFTHTQDGATYTATQARDVHKYTVDHIRYLVNSGQNTAGVIMPLIMMPSVLSVSNVNTYVNACKSDATAWNNINMIATHHYGGGTVSSYQSVYGNIQGKPLIMSEWHSANNDDIDPPAVEVMEQSSMIITALNGGAQGCWWFETNHPGNTIAGLCLQPWGSAAVFGKTYYSWKQWSVLSQIGSVRVGNTITGTGNQLSSVVLNDAANQVAVLQIINQSTSGQYIGVSIANQSLNLIQHSRTSETEDFAAVSFIVPSYPTGETVLFVAAQSLNTFELYYGIPDSTAPAAPASLIARPSGSSVSLDWDDNAETDLAGYSVYRSTVMGGPYAKIASGLVYSEYLDTAVTAGQYYYYMVTATDGSANESGLSSQAASGNLIYSSDMSSLSGWTESSNAANEAGESTGGIRVADGDKVQMNSWWDDAQWSAIGRSTGHTITAGKEYVMRVNMVSFAGGTVVALKFQNATEGLADIASASVNPLTTNWSEFTVLFSTAGGQNSSAVGDQLAIAVNAGWWNNMAVNDITVIEYEVEADTTPPAAPTGLTATAADSSVSLNWADNSEPDLSGYNVKRATVSGGPYSTIATDVSVSAYTDNTVTNGTTYYYVVSAVDASNNESTNSSQASATPQDATPPTPNPATWASAPAANGTSSIVMTATTGSDPSGPVEYFFDETSGNPGATDSGWQTSSSYTDSGLSAGTQYIYTVTLRDALGNTGTASAPASATTQSATPPAFVASGAVASGTGTITPALPSGIAAGDILLLFLETANQAISISNQNGGTWAAVTNSPQGTGTAAGTSAARLTVFWSRYNGSQGAPTASDSGNHQLGRIIAIRGAAATGNPWDVTAGGVEATSDTSGSIPGATTMVANTLVIVAVAGSLPDATGTANFSTWTNASLTSLTERTDNTVTAGNGGSLGIATGIKATAGAYGSTTVTHASSAVKGMISIAIKK